MPAATIELKPSLSIEQAQRKGGQELTKSRLDAVDFAKGLLVVCMVLYHALNYSSRYELGFKYVSFLPPSFILITGFLLQRVYFNRPASSDRTTCKRLLVRGCKLLALFTLLNIVAGMVSPRNYNGRPIGIDSLLDNPYEIYVSGEGRYAIFVVLVPITYLLIIAPGLLVLSRLHRWVIPVLAIASLIGAAVLERSGIMAGNAVLLTAGIVGVWLGRVSERTLEKVSRYWWMALLCCGMYYGMSGLAGTSFLVQLFGAIAVLALFYGLGAMTDVKGTGVQAVLHLGQYSLLGYIGQIAILQLLAHWIRRPAPFSAPWLLLAGATLLGTCVLVEICRRARTRSESIDQVYRFVLA